MKIYTKGGDAGQTGLYGGARVPKDHIRIQTYGTFDELNSCLGVVLAESTLSDDLRKKLQRLQNELFQLGAELATPRNKTVSMELLGSTHIERMEHEIDAMDAKVTALRAFVLPGGTRAAAYLHLARTVSRRGERDLVILHRAEPVRPEVLQYVNRLSDYLFECARFANFEAGVSDIPWTAPPATR